MGSTVSGVLQMHLNALIGWLAWSPRAPMCPGTPQEESSRSVGVPANIRHAATPSGPLLRVLRAAAATVTAHQASCYLKDISCSHAL